MWKSICVPAITFGNSVMVHNSKFWAKVDRIQRDVGRYAVGCQFRCAKEFVEGEIGMSTMAEREVQSKLIYAQRIKKLENDRWVNMLQSVKREMEAKTKWYRRVDFAARKLGLNKKEWEKENIGAAEIKKKVRATFDKEWIDGMKNKKSLKLYRESNRDRKLRRTIYENSQGSGLLADARAGMLQVCSLEKKYIEGMEDKCRACCKVEETLKHVVLDCKSLGHDRGTVTLQEALGFTGDINKEVNITQVRLSRWKKICVEGKFKHMY